ncbi:ferritin-like domain-containing protein [Spirosoma sordidisoli]|uniref:Ferritin-like domain-containing protein n=1 Tax=Spirosoma sordidisoli TaxID=2502893 RepID=A0A4V1RX00_9BACT|nr:ferritin-like domain-containing protein [Spirosoma sordidisoli]RYC72038.1 ferritin-like domain-containing protein [Spirosoma sordidisoli]
MNLQNILNEIEKVDAEVYERLDHVSRRHVFQNLMKKAVLGVAPVAFGSILNKAYAQNSAVVEVLNFALTLEYLEAEFYNIGTGRAGFLTGEAMTTFMQIAKHENAHVALLKSALGGAAVAKPNFDFTAKGAFPTVFTSYQTFLAVAQAFEDTGVRAYKGQAGRLIPAPDILTVALQIHSVEALHAAKVRYLNGNKGWIVNSNGFPAAVYAGDDVVVQGGVNLVGLTGLSMERVTEAFDEPLTKEQVLAIVSPFLA